MYVCVCVCICVFNFFLLFDLLYHIFLTTFLCATQSTTFILHCTGSITTMDFDKYEKNTVKSWPIYEILVSSP